LSVADQRRRRHGQDRARRIRAGAATLLLLKNAPVYSSGIQSEPLTPTGALILTEFASAFGPFRDDDRRSATAPAIAN
jgi:hypothetical protein